MVMNVAPTLVSGERQKHITLHTSGYIFVAWCGVVAPRAVPGNTPLELREYGTQAVSAAHAADAMRRYVET